KTKAEDMPKDSLFVLNLNTGGLEKLARVKSYALPAEKGGWLAVYFEKDSNDKKEKSDTTKVEKEEKSKKKSEGSRLSVRSLNGENQWDFEGVKSYGFAEKGDFLYYTKESDDSLKHVELHLLELSSGKSTLVQGEKTDFSRPTFSKESRYLAFLATDDSVKAKRHYYDLFLHPIGKGETKKIADKDT